MLHVETKNEYFFNRIVTIRDKEGEKEMIQKRESIIKKRKDSALTQQAVADKAGISRSYYAMVESGRRVPTLKTWLKIGEAIHIPKQEIIKMILESELDYEQ